LWQRLIDIAGYSTAPATVYNVALQVANELHDRRLVAVTLYKMAGMSLPGNISAAIEKYRSKQPLRKQAHSGI
jgi:hypothetical protein